MKQLPQKMLFQPSALKLCCWLLLASQLVACGSGSTDTTANTNSTNSPVTDSAKNKNPSSTDDNTASAVDALAMLEITWDRPQYRLDGSELDPAEISGYRIYTGFSADNLEQSYWISDVYQTTTQITQQLDKTFYIAILVVDIDGVESDLSPVQAIELGG